MNLTELYAMTPAEEHGNIIAAGERVYVQRAEGTDEYVLLPGGELKQVRSDSGNPLAAIRLDLATIKANLGA